MSEDNIQDVTTPTTPTDAFAQEVANPGQFTADDIAKARKQEKDKVYKTVENLQEEIALLRKAAEEAKGLEAQREAERAAKRAEREAAKKAQLEEEMSVKELLKAKEQEWQKQLEAERQERERALALLQREQEYNELQAYRNTRLAQEQDDIMPQLLDLVNGNTKDEIEQSILRAKEKTANILESVQAASLQTRKEMAGSRVTMPASGPLDTNSDQFSLSPDAIKNMSAKEYAEKRSKILGAASNNRGQGLFG
jgi:hypothetical protein